MPNYVTPTIGTGAVSGSGDEALHIPALWAKEIQENRVNNLVMWALIDGRYTSEISQKGDTLHLNFLDEITDDTSTNSPVSGLTIDGLDTDQVDLLIDRYIRKVLGVHDVLKAQSAYEFRQPYTQRLGRYLDRALDEEVMRKAKKMGFADATIGEYIGKSALEVREMRKAWGIIPTYKMVDTCAAEFEAHTPYYYSTYATEDEVEGSDALKKLGFNWVVGQSVMHEELIAFAENNGLELQLDPQGLNEIVAVTAEWNDEDACVINITTTIPAKKDVEIYFPNSVNLNESAGRYGVIRGDRKTLASKILSNHPMTFTLEDLGLDAKEDLNVVVFANGETQKFELTANNA